MRVLAVDLGSVRIGVAVSDPTGVLASPYEVVRRDGGEYARLRTIVSETGAERVIVGMPLSLDGTRRAAALAVAAEIDDLRALLGVDIETWDERFTTVTAHRGMAAAGKRSKARRQTVDAAAAAVLLQSWLDARDT